MEQKVFRGRGSVSRLQEMMDKLNVKNPLLVTRARNESLVIGQHASFSGYHPNPDFSDCAAGRDAFLHSGCDGIIAIGGGSAMDTAKAVKALLLSEKDEYALEGKITGADTIPLIAVPTTAGSGAEATPTAVVYAENRKHSIVSDCLLPRGVILDSRLLKTLPREQKIASAMDALSQGIESYISKSATEDSQVLAYLGILGVLDNIRPYLDGEIHAADEMIDAAFHSGKAIRTSRTTAAHAMSYPMTKQLGIPHGQACILTLPALWDMMVDDENVLPLLMDLAAKMRLGSEYLVSRLIRGMIYDFGLEYKGKVDNSLLESLTEAVNMDSLKNHPTFLSPGDIKMAYARALYGTSESEKQMCLDIWRYYGEEE